MKIRFKSSIQLRKLVGVILLVCGLPLSSAQGVTFVSFDIPGSAYIQPQAINPSGVITGWWQDASLSIHHGFVRALDGTITPIDLGSDTQPQAISPSGTIVGFYTDQFGTHGFVRAPNTKITTLDFGNGSYTLAYGINPAGAVAGIHLSS